MEIYIPFSSVASALQCFVVFASSHMSTSYLNWNVNWYFEGCFSLQTAIAGQWGKLPDAFIDSCWKQWESWVVVWTSVENMCWCVQALVYFLQNVSVCPPHALHPASFLSCLCALSTSCIFPTVKDVHLSSGFSFSLPTCPTFHCGTQPLLPFPLFDIAQSFHTADSQADRQFPKL